MSEQTHPLPANRAFVIQLRTGITESEIRHRGRAEHLASGQVARFSCEAELWAFVDRVLTAMAESSEADPPLGLRANAARREQDP